MTNSKVSSIIYCHGVGGNPNRGEKVTAIRNFAAKHEIGLVAPQFDEEATVAEMVEYILSIIKAESLDLSSSIFLGSSRGAFICAKASSLLSDQEPAGVFLLAPPIGIKPDYYKEQFPLPTARHIDVVHGYFDDLIPVENVISFCKNNKYRLHLINEGHRLTAEKKFILNVLGFQKRLIEADSS